MSTTFSIACKDCKEHLWIAQGYKVDNNGVNGHIYSTQKYSIEFYKFFRKHQGHSLIFDDNINSEILDYLEIEIDE